MRTLLHFYILIVAFLGVLIFDAAPLGAAPSSVPPNVVIRPNGPIEVVFNHDTSACFPEDVPDDGTRAFRDAHGMVHLISSGAQNLAMVGTTLNNVHRVCNILYEDHKSADPSKFDDMGWLESFYTLDGNTVYGLISHDYHPDRHHLPCGSSAQEADLCWYSDITQAISTDGGQHFVANLPGAERFIAGAPYKFDPNHPSPVGAFVVSNIVPFEGDYYAFISVAADGAQHGGDCLMRTNNLGNPGSWRAWDGRGFNVRFIDPYTTQNFDPAQHVCAPVAPGQLKYPVRSLLALANGRGFVVTMQSAYNKPDGTHIQTVVSSASADLLHWSEPAIIQEFEPHDDHCTPTSKHVFMYSYPSLLDPNSPSLNFDTVGNSAFLYMMRVRRCGGMQRDLVRLPVSIEVYP